MEICKKELCTGCTACQSVCTKACISMQEDELGHLYAQIDETKCIDCGACRKLCPSLNPVSGAKPSKAYAAISKDVTEYKTSTSGGAAAVLSKHIVENGGVVYGCTGTNGMDNCHVRIDNVADLHKLKGSKYVQSEIGSSYEKAKKHLKEGKKVLFSGTPCQIAGLRKFLRKDYNTLLTVEVVCHGAPAPLVWRTYLNKEIAKCGKDLSGVEGINFRDKLTGWKTYSLSVKLSENIVSASLSKDNDYMRAFLSNLSLRHSCYNCPAKSGKSGADITIGDFWGIENVRPELDDDKGLSLVMVNSPKGMTSLKTLNCEFVPVGFDEAVKGNSAYYQSVSKPVNREFFFHCIRTGHNVQDALAACESANVFPRVRRIMFRKLGL